MTEINVIDNAVATERVTRLRDAATPNREFRRLLRDLSSILVYEALRRAPLAPVDVTTPMGPANGARFERLPLIVPVLRAGLGMLDAALDLLGDAEVAFVGLRRNEATLVAREYASTLPESLDGRDALILDPMLATGGSCIHACELLREARAAQVTAVCVIAAPEGLEKVRRSGLADAVYVAALDESLNDDGFILPGLGDAGDRQFNPA
ncbi:MAG: uracil phosphoribosyltransferase [Acidimicrobiaceae bacterium]|nr:uracil phosphoribosyltransferase [Acidimicrobiaceae bacterium]MCY4176441.1 uracil phosphoribosyltransferase [Acidimicrobiaceae bacterium]MCY4280021.1 uracil phosphoribosyltransferase [Acidimicrobiaceae bacterium]MCY4294429.1 uracil phosphoribosyltransferase [Acidimicrobiaceae bacterium]